MSLETESEECCVGLGHGDSGGPSQDLSLNMLLLQSPSVDVDDKMLLTHLKTGNAESQGKGIASQPSVTVALDKVFLWLLAPWLDSGCHSF